MNKERLVKLINKAKEEYANDVTDHTETDYIVECLLNEGAIIPPCKVGDTVWFIEQGICFGDKRISEGFVSHFDIRELPGMGLTHNVVIIPRDAIDNRMRFSLFECFDEDYCTSREEAEVKLKGGAKNNEIVQSV